MTHNCDTQATALPARKNETITLIVVIITLVTMAVEIIAGMVSGSMALLSDGIHMGTHALALFITLAAYIFARKQRQNPAFSFGTGKVGILGGYTNAILLILAAAAMAGESVERLIRPVEIHFNEAIVVAVIGLGVNILSAVILGQGHGDHGHDGHSHEDHNLKAAYLHVITDALTSVLAIAALVMGKFLGFAWADPLVGILGAFVVGKWALGLLRQTSALLLDKGDTTEEIEALRRHIESETTAIKDIHIWQISENERSLILSIHSTEDREPAHYHRLAREIGQFAHITVEINRKTESAYV